MSNETIPLNLFKANLELQLRLNAWMQENGQQWLENATRAAAKTLPSPAPKSKACSRPRNWQELATLPANLLASVPAPRGRRAGAGQVTDQNQTTFTQGLQIAIQDWQKSVTQAVGQTMQYSRSRIFSNSGGRVGPARDKDAPGKTGGPQCRLNNAPPWSPAAAAAWARPSPGALHDAGHTVLIVHSPGNSSIGAWLGKPNRRRLRLRRLRRGCGRPCLLPELATSFKQTVTIDILVNNAGITRDDATFRKLSYAGGMRSCASISTPFSTSPGHSSTACSRRGWGGIVNIASIQRLQRGSSARTNYSAAKAGMHGFTKALAQEVARKGVTVNTVSPGYLDTKMVTSMSASAVSNPTARSALP